MYFQHRAGNAYTPVVNWCLSTDCSSEEHGFSTNEEHIGEDVDVDFEIYVFFTGCWEWGWGWSREGLWKKMMTLMVEVNRGLWWGCGDETQKWEEKERW